MFNNCCFCIINICLIFHNPLPPNRLRSHFAGESLTHNSNKNWVRENSWYKMAACRSLPYNMGKNVFKN